MSDSMKLSVGVVVGQKAGMTRIFDKDGNTVPVTVIKLIPSKITQVKLAEKDGYSALQVGYYQKRESILPKPLIGHLRKAKVENNFARFYEVKTDSANIESLGAEVDFSNLSKIEFVDVTGVSKGKGFQGVMKRHGFAGGPGAHGSQFHRRSGSIGNRATPARVFAEKKMPGHMGDEKVTVQNLKVVEVNTEKGYMLVRGCVPGANESFVFIKQSVKK
ncbi:MAG: 50S ribosomal protein L3 [Bacteriovoracaceae bacterium]|nr:50S ribosomal protein L3 [Bacteriovoracaceae bacterium]